jgi:hypothetical protein
LQKVRGRVFCNEELSSNLNFVFQMSLAENEVDEERREFCTFHTNMQEATANNEEELDYVQKQQKSTNNAMRMI